MNAVHVTGLDYAGRGVAKADGKVIFIAGALPDEKVTYHIERAKKRFAEARVDAVLEASPLRVVPQCEYYAQCGGCALQHLQDAAQLEAKQEQWKEQLARLGNANAAQIDAPLTQASWHYRSRARLSVDYQQGQVTIGFKARRSAQVVGINQCLVLDAALNAMLPHLSAFLQARLPHKVRNLSLHRGAQVCALAFDMAEGHVPKKDWEVLCAQLAFPWQLWINNRCIYGDAKALYYELPQHQKIIFNPLDFTQVNVGVNQQMITAALAYLGDVRGKKGLDLFSGLGNFSLPLAQAGAEITALEGVQQMVARAQQIAKENGLGEQIHCQRADLFTQPRLPAADFWLLDPPRAGAMQVCEALTKAGGPEKMVYVSCNPATLARDAKILQEKGYSLVRGRVANMFPQTSHIESVNLFVRGN